MKRQQLLLILLIVIIHVSKAQNTICITKTIAHNIHSKHLKEQREYWISLPHNYSDSLKYPVIYVLDAEWRFDIIRHITFDLGANNKIKNAIIVGIPHIDWDKKRGRDLTFSQSRIEYDGDNVDDTFYNSSNSGEGLAFFNYLTKELIPDVNTKYSTNNHETLVGHSYGGYFGGYILSLTHPFEVLHIYDPSIWFSNGEVIDRLKKTSLKNPITIHLTYQPIPEFHKHKIEEFINVLDQQKHITLTKTLYKNDTHNSLFLDSFYKGIITTNRD